MTPSHELARISIVNYNGHVLMDKFVKPKRKIVNYLTWVSGVTPELLKNAVTFDEIFPEIKKILQ
jgi:RNA exonuclease 4